MGIHPNIRARPLLLVGIVVLLSIASVAAFAAGRALSGGQDAVAQVPDPSQDPDFLVATPAPGEEPDFSQPFWAQKWRNQDAARERSNLTINGIAVGPTVQRITGGLCDENNRPVSIQFAEAQQSRVGIHFGYLPAGLTVKPLESVACRGEPGFNGAFVDLPRALDGPELRERLARGENYYDLPRGGYIEVYRMVAGPAFESSIPVERWFGAEIAGYPAAIGRPILDGGFGDGAVIVHADGVLTVVRTINVSLDEMIRVAEGLFE